MNLLKIKFTNMKLRPMTEIQTDKRPEYDFGMHCKEGPGSDDPEVIEAWEKRHRDKLLDDYCDTHPGSVECKVFDD